MTLHVFTALLQNGTSSPTNPVIFDLELRDAFLKRVTATLDTAKLIGFRLTHNGLTLIPWPGPALAPFVLFDNSTPDVTSTGRFYVFTEFRQLSGPPYRVRLEAYNTDTSPRNLEVFFETTNSNFQPVNILDVKENAVPKTPQPQTPNAGY